MQLQYFVSSLPQNFHRFSLKPNFNEVKENTTGDRTTLFLRQTETEEEETERRKRILKLLILAQV